MTERVVTGSLQDLASVPGMPSEPTLRKFIRDCPDFPAIGKDGGEWQIDIERAIGWIRARREADLEADRSRREEVRQFALDLLGEDAASSKAEAGLSAAERKALLEEELVAIKVAERRGDLVRKESVEAALAAIIVIDAQRRASFTARLTKRIEVPRDIIAAIDGLIEHDRKVFAGELEKLSEGSDADAANGADTAV